MNGQFEVVGERASGGDTIRHFDCQLVDLQDRRLRFRNPWLASWAQFGPCRDPLGAGSLVSTVSPLSRWDCGLYCGTERSELHSDLGLYTVSYHLVLIAEAPTWSEQALVASRRCQCGSKAVHLF